MLMIPNISAINSQILENIITNKISYQSKLKNINFNKIENKLLDKILNIFEFWFAWIIIWAILVDDFFSKFHPFIYNMMETFPFIILFFPMSYILFIVAFFQTLSDYLQN